MVIILSEYAEQRRLQQARADEAYARYNNK